MLKKIIEGSNLIIITPPHPCLLQLRPTLIMQCHVRDNPLCTLNDSTESHDREDLTATPVIHEEEASDVDSNSDNGYGGNTITKQCPTTSSKFELQFHFEMTIVSGCMSCHLKEFKLHFNYFPILDTTVTELTAILHPNRGSFASEQALNLLSLPPAHTAHSLTQCIITAQTFPLSS